MTTDLGYSHTQKAPLCLILYCSALACIVLALIDSETNGIYIGGGVGLLIALLGPAFHHLTVVNQGDVLAIRFGPVPLFRRTVRYANIEKVEVGRRKEGGFVARAFDSNGLVFENNISSTLAEAMAALEEGLTGRIRNHEAALRSSSHTVKKRLRSIN